MSSAQDLLRDAHDLLELMGKEVINPPTDRGIQLRAMSDHLRNDIRRALDGPPEFTDQQRRWILNGLKSDRDDLRQRARQGVKRFYRDTATAEICREPAEYIASLLLRQASILDAAIADLERQP